MCYLMLKGIIEYSHDLLKKSISAGEIAIDATCGNGNDTLFLSKLVGEEGRVIAFDIQQMAIQNSQQLMTNHERNNVTFIHDSHANVEKHLSDALKGKIGGAIFNLGYLPRSDKTIITKGDSTVAAIDSLLKYIKKDGLIVIVIYHGHEGGELEKSQVLDYVMSLDQKEVNVVKYRFINQKNNPPFVVAIHKK